MAMAKVGDRSTDTTPMMRKDDALTVREFNARLDEIRRAADGALIQASEKVVGLRDYVDALFNEKERAREVATDEREKSASALREEQRRAMETAEREREKSAQALRDAMARSIETGDEHLREHIASQIRQLQTSLDSAEKLELERVEASHSELIALIEANTRVFEAVQLSSEKAVDKAEEAQRRVNNGQNEFRAALSDLSALNIPRKEVEGLFGEQGRQNAELRAALAELRTQIAVGPAGLPDLQTFAARAEGAGAQVLEGRAVQNTNVAAAALAAQIRGLYVAVMGIAVTGVIGVLAAVATHGFK